MRCKKCGAENPDAKRTCSECGAFLEGYTLNNVTGEYGYRGADGLFYMSEEDYRAKSTGAQPDLQDMCMDMPGRYDSRKELEREAPRKLGNMARTDNAKYCYDGKAWLIVAINQYVTFEVVSRCYVTGRGYITVIHNQELLPIDKDRSAVCKGQYRLPIHGIEITAKPTARPEPKPDWGLVTSEETVGKFLTVRMYPDEDENVSIDTDRKK